MTKGKYVKKQSLKNSKKKICFIVVVAVLLLLLAAGFGIFVIPQWLYSLNNGGGILSGTAGAVQDEEAADNKAEHNSTDEENNDVPENEISFPISVKDGMLEITSLHSYNGINPDCGNQEGQNVVGITLRNISEVYLAEANMTVTLSDGTAANFRVTDLPAGRTAMAFSAENAELSADAGYVDVSCESKFDPAASMSEDAVSVNVDGTTITLTNTSGSDLNNVVVYCHNILDPDYFGGMTYMYTVENLTVGASATVDARDCILGMVEVVRIDVE